MTRGKHTPGPWMVGDVRHAGASQLVLHGQRRGFVAEVQAPLIGDRFDKEAREANARLIAAAPELLEALGHAVTYIGTEGTDDSPEAREARRVAQAAIAKATGGQP